MLAITVQLTGRQIHLVLHPSDCASCPNRDKHQPVERLAFLATELGAAAHRNGPLLGDLRELVSKSRSLYSPHRVSDRDVVQHIGAMLQERQLIAIECRVPDEYRIFEKARPPAIVPPKVPAPRPARAAETVPKTWIEIELTDARGKPVPNQKYRIVLPDGVPQEGTLDAKGRARFTDIDPGMCNISFPEIDGREWKEVQG